MMVVSTLFLILWKALTQWGGATCKFQGQCMGGVGFVGVFSVVHWIFKFSVFNNGTNS